MVGEGDGQLWWVALQGAIVVCCGWGKVTANFAGVDAVPLLGAIAGRHCSVLWLGEGDGQLWGSGRGAIAGCHCSVLWLWEGDGQLLGSGRGAIAECHCSVLWFLVEGDGQLWGSGRGAIAGCHCS